MCTAHLHGIFEFCSQLINVKLHTFFSTAIDRYNERPADQYTVSTKCKCLENVCTGTDSSVNQNLHRTVHFFYNLFLGQFFPGDMCILFMIRTVYTTVDTVIGQVQRCKILL